MSDSDTSLYHGLWKPWLIGIVTTDVLLLPAGSIWVRLTACHCAHAWPHASGTSKELIMQEE